MTAGSPVIAANLRGQFIAAWDHFTRFVNPTYELRATTGAGDRAGTPAVLVAGDQGLAEDTTSAGIDGQGNVAVTWERFSDRGPVGLFEATYP